MKKVLLPILLTLLCFTMLAQKTTATTEAFFTVYDTKQAFVAGSTDYALSEYFTGIGTGVTKILVNVTCVDSIDTDGATAATPAKYIVATLQASNDGINFFAVGNAMVDKPLCAVPATTASAGLNNKGLSTVIEVDVTLVNSAYIRFRYDLYAAGSRLTDATTNTTVKTTLYIPIIK